MRQTVAERRRLDSEPADRAAEGNRLQLRNDQRDWEELYSWALLRSLSGDLEPARRDEDGREAVESLIEAVRKGYRNVARLQRDVGFPAWLRQRDDFKHLVHDLEQKAAPPG